MENDSKIISKQKIFILFRWHFDCIEKVRNNPFLLIFGCEGKHNQSNKKYFTVVKYWEE